MSSQTYIKNDSSEEKAKLYESYRNGLKSVNADLINSCNEITEVVDMQVRKINEMNDSLKMQLSKLLTSAINDPEASPDLDSQIESLQSLISKNSMRRVNILAKLTTTLETIENTKERTNTLVKRRIDTWKDIKSNLEKSRYGRDELEDIEDFSSQNSNHGVRKTRYHPYQSSNRDSQGSSSRRNYYNFKNVSQENKDEDS